MSEEKLFRRCLFIRNKECLVDVDEIPLEVCRMCIEAWKVEVSRIMVRREVIRTLKDASLALVELDRMFERGEIELNEYISRRNEVLKSLSQPTHLRVGEKFKRSK